MYGRAKKYKPLRRRRRGEGIIFLLPSTRISMASMLYSIGKDCRYVHGPNIGTYKPFALSDFSGCRLRIRFLKLRLDFFVRLKSYHAAPK